MVLKGVIYHLDGVLVDSPGARLGQAADVPRGGGLRLRPGRLPPEGRRTPRCYRGQSERVAASMSHWIWSSPQL
jgi:hypothetical protein